VPAENSKQQPLPRRKLRPERPGMITSVIGNYDRCGKKKVMISFATMVMMTTRVLTQEERSGTLAN
jgi:hypothetical protein